MSPSKRNVHHGIRISPLRAILPLAVSMGILVVVVLSAQSGWIAAKSAWLSASPSRAITQPVRRDRPVRIGPAASTWAQGANRI